MTHKPIIAITGPAKGQRFSIFFSSLFVRLYGGQPLIVTPEDYNDHIDFDGLLISGGTDIFPDHYGGNIKNPYIYDHARDEMEFALLARAENEGKPVLGICRGAQLINVHRKGSLHFDVRKAYEKAEYPSSLLARIFYRKKMHILKGDSLIGHLLACRACRVNSIHTQSVDILGADLEITAQEKNGVIQAIEDRKRPYYLGVQFHPEYLGYSRSFRNIFKKLVFTARNM